MTSFAVDLQALQSRGSRNRGIGRYVQSLLETLLRQNNGLSYTFYTNQTLPEPAFAAYGHPVRRVDYPAAGNGGVNEVLLKATLLGANVERLFLPSPMADTDAVVPNYTTFPATVFAICYDLIPLVFADTYLSDPSTNRHYFDQLKNVRSADWVFAISEATRQDAIRYLDLKPDRVVNISAGVSPFFKPLAPSEHEDWRRRLADKLGIVRPFVLYTGGDDWRKNIEGLVHAFALLPSAERTRYQLVIACKLSEPSAAKLTGLAHKLGLGRALVLTNFVTDEELRALYALCALFVFPSLYEGFGLPLVEAMACGAPVIAADNSSLPEVVGAKDQRFDARSPETIAHVLQAHLCDEQRRRQLASAAIGQAARFSWQAVAQRVADVFGADTSRREATLIFTRSSGARPKKQVAYFSPFRPLPSGISDYTHDLLLPLSKHFTLDLYHEPGYVPDLETDRAVFSQGSFENNVHDPNRDYDAIVYQMGNSSFHGYIYAHLLRYGGVTVLHDYSLSGMLLHLTTHRPDLGVTLQEELEHSYGASKAQDITRGLASGELDIVRLSEQGVHTNRRIFTRSLGVVVHSRWAHEKAVAQFASDNECIAHIPMVIPSIQNERDAQALGGIRNTLDVPADAFVIASFGFLAPTKRTLPILDGFQRYAAANPRGFLLFVGATDHFPGDMDAEVRKRGLQDRVKVTGFVSMDSFYQCIAISDLCVNLRFPYHGETSAALLRLLSQGKPTLVTNIGSFADLPDEVVHKIPPPDQGDEVVAIAKALTDLAGNAAYRTKLAQNARDFVAREHSPARCARLYADFLGQVMRAPATRRKLLADHVGREVARVASGDPTLLFAPFREALGEK